MKRKTTMSLALAAAAMTAVPLQTAIAQAGATQDLALEEIVVSARKRDESLQEIPIAVDVFDAAKLQQYSINRVEDLARFSSGLTFDQGVLPTDTRPVIRGATSQRGRPNAGVLVDFVDVSSESLTVAGGGITTNIRLLDLERVEIVKGPQSALYGRSAFTGAINYVTRRPSDEFESEVMVGVDEHDTWETKFSVGGPLIDGKLNARAVFANYEHDGYFTNPNTGGGLGWAESVGGALALDYTHSDTMSAYLRVEMSNDELGQRAEALIQSMDSAYDPFANQLGTGTVTDNATMVPHEFQGEVCNGIDRIQPYYDSFDFGFGPLGPACRPLITGELTGTESMIDLAPDPRTGRDFLGTDMDTVRIHLDLEWDLPYANVMYIGGYMQNDTHVQEDFSKVNDTIVSSFVPFPPPGMAVSQYGVNGMSEQILDTEQWNHELRISGDSDKVHWMISVLNWEEDMDLQFDDEWWLRDGGDPGAVLGLLNQGPFAFLSDDVTGTGISSCGLFFGSPPFFTPPPGCVNDVTFIATGPGNTPALPIVRETSHWSVAAMVSIDVTDQLVLNLEGRAIDEEINYLGQNADISFFSQFGADPWWGFLFGPGEIVTNSVEEDAFVPKVTVDYHVNEDVMVYGSYSEAFKPGGVSTTDANADITDGEYTSEELKAYELGWKSEFRDSSIRLNGAFYFYDYTDQQVPFQFFSPTTNLLQTSIVNAGETEIKGFETDLVWRSAFVDGLSVSLGYTYTDAEYTDFNLSEILGAQGATPSAFNRAKAGNAEADFTGKVPNLTPEHSATASVRYDFGFGTGKWGFVELFTSYMDKRFVSEDNRSYLPEHTLLDLYTGFGSDAWDVSLYVVNLTDEDKITSGIGNVDYSLLPDGRSLSQSTTIYLPQPRTVGARLTYKFGN